MPSESTALKNRKRLPAWAPWLIGYAALWVLAVALVYYWRVVFLLPASLPATALTLAVGGLFSFIFLGVLAISRIKEAGTSLRAALVVFLAGLLFCFATGPLQVPDEGAHYLRAVSVSMGRFNYDYTETYPDDVYQLLEHFPAQMNHAITYQGGELMPDAIIDYQQAIETNAPASRDVDPPIMFLLLPFLHQGLFMAVARLLGFSALGMLYAGRLANLALYAVFCYLAFKNCARHRGVFLVVALLPLSLFMAASCSYDSVMLGACLLAASFVCRQSVQARDLWVFAAAVMLAAYIKPNNIMLAALLLLVPKESWKLSWKRVWVVALCAALAGVFYLALGRGLDEHVLKVNWPAVLPRGSGEAAPESQLGFMLRYPFRFASTAFLSLVERGAFLFDLGRLGTMDLNLPLVSGLSVVSLLAGAVLGVEKKRPAGRWLVPGMLAFVLVYVAAVLAGMYVAESDYQSIRIMGLQARYFIPAFLVLFMALSLWLGRFFSPRLDGGHPLVSAEQVCLWLAAGLAFVAALALFQSYYVGQWVPRAEGGFKLVNLFGWVQ